MWIHPQIMALAGEVDFWDEETRSWKHFAGKLARARGIDPTSAELFRRFSETLSGALDCRIGDCTTVESWHWADSPAPLRSFALRNERAYHFLRWGRR